MLAILAYTGLAVCAYRWRRPAYLLALISILAGFTAAVLTSGASGDMRRSLMAMPMVYGVAGAGLIAIVDVLRHYGASIGQRWVTGGGVAVLCLVALLNLNYYFGEWSNLERVHWSFADDFTSSIQAAAAQPDHGPVYFYSGRWSYNYEPRQFLYPTMAGQDRSREFGKFSLDKPPGPATFVLLPPYTAELANLTRLYPGGQTVTANNEQGQPRFTVYRAP